MRSARFPQLLGLLAVGVAACAHGKAAVPAGEEPPAPTTAIPHSTLTAEDIQRMPGRTIEQLLLDGFPGVVAAARMPGGGISVRIRGVGSFMSSTEPLFVVDGDPLPSSDALKALNPFDIELIEVIKDPAGTALYGVRGANGVIVIKTKTRD
ncbi:MAG TPA: TonB-dependent receptor plug domain-containing protein [Gemmatimonadales bacterium]|nr:TonB-dependent receptor plug domain-containing protein [Gemmatimonadales bacterium]